MLVPTETRQALPDQLRGLALLGIVLVNMPFLAISTAGFTGASVDTLPDRLVAFGVVALAQGKFYLLFAFLFGYGLTLMLRRRAGDGLRRYRRRLVGLAVLGLLHAVLFFIADILVSYALLGLVLLWFVSRSDRTALRGAAASFAVGVGLLTTLVVVSWGQSSAGLVSDVGAFDSALRGSFLDGAQARLSRLPEMLVVGAFLNWAGAFGMFLLGLVAGRRGLLARPDEHRRLWTRLLLLAAVVGLPGGIVAGWLAHGPGSPGTGDTDRDLLAVAIGFGTAPALAGGYVALIAIATRSRVLRLVSPAGRMSLTGYLGESILLAAIFCGWGLGLYGRLGAASAALVALGVWAALEVFAHAWLHRYAYGPFEWLLRCWTYRQIVPLRQRPTAYPCPPRGFAAARSQPPSRATAESRPRDHPSTDSTS